MCIVLALSPFLHETSYAYHHAPPPLRSVPLHTSLVHDLRIPGIRAPLHTGAWATGRACGCIHAAAGQAHRGAAPSGGRGIAKAIWSCQWWVCWAQRDSSKRCRSFGSGMEAVSAVHTHVYTVCPIPSSLRDSIQPGHVSHR